MASVLQQEPFNFDNAKRNALLTTNGFTMPTAMKTGTTIAGIIFAGGVVLGADTRATEGPIVADKNCEKIHYLSQYIHCCGAGTSADTENTTNLVRSQLELHKLATGAEPRVSMAMTRLKQRLYQYQGHISAALVLGGVDTTGSYLYCVYPHGSVDKLPYATMGSGSLAAMAVFEQGFTDDMSEADAVELVSQAIQAGIYNDLGSGSNVDIMIIRKPTAANSHKPSTQYIRSQRADNARIYQRKAGYEFPIGSTEWIAGTEVFTPNETFVAEAAAAASTAVAMETS